MADCKQSHVPAKMRFVAHVARPQTKINHSTEYDDLMMRMRGTGDARTRQTSLAESFGATGTILVQREKMWRCVPLLPIFEK